MSTELWLARSREKWSNIELIELTIFNLATAASQSDVNQKSTLKS